MKPVKVAARGLAVVATALPLVAVSAFPANAAPANALFLTTSCTVHSNILYTSTSCKTGTIHAANDRKMNYHMCGAPNHYADWQIKDANNGHIVAQGRVQAKVCVTDTVSGLYGDYWSWVFNTRDNASAEIDNS